MSILLLPKTAAPKHSALVQSDCFPSVPYRALRVSCNATEVPSIVARSSNEGSIKGKRQPRRHERDALREQVRAAERRSNSSPWVQQPDVLDATDDNAVLAATSSCSNEQELNILYTFLLDQQKQKANGFVQQSTPSSPSDQLNKVNFPPPPQALPQAPIPPDPSPLQAPPRSPQQPSAENQQRLSPQQAVHLLARLSQLSPSPALAASPLLDTTLAYDPLPQASIQNHNSSSSSSSSAPAVYMQPQLQLQQLQHQQQQQQHQQQQGQQQRQQQQPRSAQAHRGGSVQAAAQKDRASEIVEEEEAEDAESARAMQERTQQQHFVEGLLSSAMCGLPQLPLSSITGLLSALARLGYRCRHKHQNPVAQIAAHLLHRNALLLMYRRDPRALAHTAWALAKLGHDPGPHWISQFLLASSASLPKFTAVDLSATAWSLARWRFRPTPQWLDAYYTRLGQVAPQLKTQGICNVCWALTVLRVPPPRDVAELLMMEAQVQLPFFSATALATLCWSLAALGHKPPMFWLHEVFDSLTRALPKVPLTSRGVPHANMAWALSVWQVSSPSDFLAHLCTTATPHLPRMSATSCAVLLTGLADLGHRPKQAWVSLALEEFHKRHSDASPSSLVAVVWAVSRLLQPAGTDSSPPVDWTPPRKWRVRYAHILQDIAWAQSRAFSALEPAQLVDAAVAFADLSFYPGDEWMDRHEAYCDMKVEAFTAYQVRLLSTCMEKLDSIFEGDYLPRDGEVV